MADITGTPGNDRLAGTPGPDRIFGLAGDDILRGLGGNDRLFGGPGDDRLVGGPGDDVLNGGAGTDTLLGGAGADVLNGGAGDDELFGNAGRDRLSGGAGNDRLSGGLGDDVLNGGPGADVLAGGPGADTFVIGHVAHGVDRVTDFDPAEDALDVWPAIPRLDPGAEVADFVAFRATAEGTVVALDPSGSGGPFRDVALLEGVEIAALPPGRLGLPETVLATPDPIPGRIAPGNIVVELVELVRMPATDPEGRGGASPPRTRINGLEHADDGSGRLFVNDTRGQLWVIEDGRVNPEPVVDLDELLGDGFFDLDDFWDGLRDFAFHHDFENPDAPGFGKLYIAYTATVGSAANRPDTPLFGLNRLGQEVRHHNVIAEVTLDPETLALQPDSYRELLRAEDPFRNHGLVDLDVNPNAEPGDPDYGLLYAAFGDGGTPPTNTDAADPLGMAQDPGTALGSMFRIDPLPSGDDGRPYGVPDDNPFVGRAGFLPETWAYGLRDPQFFSWDPGGDGKMIIADIGGRNVEEVNLGVPGANYGWAEREGTFVLDPENPLVLYELPENEPRDFTYPVAQYGRGADGLAIAGGFVHRGDNVPELEGKYLFGDIVNGRIFYVDADALELGRLAEISELRLVIDGRETGFLRFLNGTVGAQRADLRFGQGEDGEVYVLSKQDGVVRSFRPVGGGAGPASAATTADDAPLSPDDVLGGGAGGPAAAAVAALLPAGGGGGLDDLLGPAAAAAGV